MNMVFNILIMKYAHAWKHYCSTLLPTNRVLFAVGIHPVRYEHLCCVLREDLGITIIISLKTYLITKHHSQTLNSIQKEDPQNKIIRSESLHMKINR